MTGYLLHGINIAMHTFVLFWVATFIILFPLDALWLRARFVPLGGKLE